VRSLGKLIAPIVAIATSSAAFAAMDREARLTELENQMQQVRTETAMDTYGANTASARPNVDGRNWFIMLDVLYWRTKIGGTEYAYSDQDPIASLPISGRTKHMEFKWDWGIRAGLGYNFEYDCWDLRGQYTWFDTSGSDSTHAGLNSSIVPLRGSAIITGREVIADTTVSEFFVFCTSAKSQYDMDYQSIDIELGRDYYVSSKLSFRPHWGLKTAWFDLEQSTRYTGGVPAGIEGIDGFLGLQHHTVHVKEKSDFWGLGPRTGVETRWYLGEGFSLFGNFAAALLYGHFEVDHKEKFTRDAEGRIRLHADRHAFSPTVQYQMGLRWDTYFNDDKYHFTIGLGFDGEYWWRMNQMLKIDDSNSFKYERYSEDLSMYGITLDMKFEF